MPLVPLLAGLVAVLAVALVLLVVEGRRARSSAPDDATLEELRARLDALRGRYAEIGAEVSALVAEAGAVSTEATTRDTGLRAPQPTAPPTPAQPDDRYVSTTAPASVRSFPSPSVPSVPASPPAASA